MVSPIIHSTRQKIQNLQNHMVSSQRTMDMNPEVVFNELEALSFSISHDLRAPLRAIRNNCEWLSSQYGENFGAKESVILQQIANCSEQMEKLLDGLLAFSKVVKSTPQHTVLDMTGMAQKVLDELLEGTCAPSSYTVALHPLEQAYGNATLIRQVWYNLLTNALKYTQYKEKKEIKIESFIAGGEIVYSVSDNGVGFDMQYVDRLFGVFHRLHDAGEFEGIGVGLAIVKRIIQRHGGRVWAEGKVDEGARFYFTLPRISENISETIG